MAQNYKLGKYVSPWAWGGNRTHNINDWRWRGADQRLRGTLDWDSLKNVQGHLKDLKMIRQIADKEYEYFKSNDGGPLDNVGGNGPAHNPFHSQGLGPKNYAGFNARDRAKIQSRFWEATESKFRQRETELLGVETAGGWDAYNQQAADRAELAISHPDAARAAELLRSETGGSPRARTPGGASLGQSRHARYARFNERQRNPVRRPGGSVSRKRLRAASMLGQPLGGGSQSAAQLLG